MFLIMTEVSILVILLLIIECRAKETTVKTIIIETTTEYVTYITDIPEEDVNQALIQGYGRYTTQSFLYDNHQYYQAFPVDHERCIEDMIKCNADIVVPIPVCVYNDPPDVNEGYRVFISYCDAYFDSCLRKMRFWRILDFGRCKLNYELKELQTITKTRKKYGTTFKKLYELISSKQGIK